MDLPLMLAHIKSVFPVSKVTGQTLRQTYSVANYACRGCPIGCDRIVSEGKGEPAAKFQSFKDLFDDLTLCKFAPLQVPWICEMLNPLTGWKFNPATGQKIDRSNRK